MDIPDTPNNSRLAHPLGIDKSRSGQFVLSVRPEYRIDKSYSIVLLAMSTRYAIATVL